MPLTVAALWRSRAVPRGAAALPLAFMVLDVAGQGAQAALLVVAHVIPFVAADWIALAVVRRTPIG